MVFFRVIYALIPVLLFCGTALAQTGARVIYTSPDGLKTNPGTLAQPVDIATALSGRLTPAGSTVYLRGGTYKGPFLSYVTGTASAPVTVRAYPGERAVLSTDYQFGEYGVLNVYGSWAIYRDFEVTVQSTVRTYSSGSFRPMGVQVQGPNTKFVNLVVHDTGMGFGFWADAVDAELYGNLIYNCGTQNSMSDKRYGHGIYMQNETGIKKVRDNVIVNQFGWGIHAFGAPLSGFLIDGNIIFNNGSASGSVGNMNNILVSGAPATGVTITSNYLYHPLTTPGHGVFADANLCLGCTHDVANGELVLSDNYFAGGTPSALIANWSKITMSRNTVVSANAFNGIAAPSGVFGSTFIAEDNTYVGGTSPVLFGVNGQIFQFAGWQQATKTETRSLYKPGVATGKKVILRPNAYDPNRANLAIYNWDKAATVAVDLSSVLPVGATFEIRNAQNYFGTPVVAGTYGGGSVNIPMTGLPTAPPTGWTAPAPTGPEFNAFIVLRK